MPPEFVCFFTDARVDYDGFGTETLADIGEDARRRHWRLVAIRREHAQWQRDRYISGLHVCLGPENAREMELLRQQLAPQA